MLSDALQGSQSGIGEYCVAFPSDGRCFSGLRLSSNKHRRCKRPTITMGASYSTIYSTTTSPAAQGAACEPTTTSSEVVTSTPYITYDVTSTFYTTFTLPGTPPFFFPTTTSSLTSTITTTSDPFFPITYTTYFVEDNVCPNTNACYATGPAGSSCEFTAQLFQLSVAT